MLVQQEDVYLNFVNSIKSDVTKQIHEYNLRLFMEFCNVDKFESLIGQQDKIIPYLMSLNWESTSNFGDNIKIRPINFSTEHRNMLSNLHAVISKSYLAVEDKHDKLITSLRTAWANELSLDKNQTSYNDLFDALRLSLKGCNIG